MCHNSRIMDNSSSSKLSSTENSSSQISPLRTPLIVVLIVCLLIATGLTGFYFGQKQSGNQNGNVESPPVIDEGVVCTLDAMMCPDGSAVGRQAPNCEFAPCPGELGNSQSTIDDYFVSKTGFSVELPSGWAYDKDLLDRLSISIGANPSDQLDPIIYGYYFSPPGARLNTQEMRNSGFEVIEEDIHIDGTLGKRMIAVATENVQDGFSSDYINEVTIPQEKNGTLGESSEIILVIYNQEYIDELDNILETFKYRTY